MPIFESYEKLLEKNPNDIVALINMGIMHGYKKEIDKAVECFEKVFQLDPYNASARHNLNIVLGKGKTYDSYAFAKREK